jgi:hypothetical protein
MAQVHLTLEDEILKDLMLGNRENGVAKLLKKYLMRSCKIRSANN